MSNYTGIAYNPITESFQKAQFIDNYYGRHEYAVKFSDSQIYSILDVMGYKETGKNSYLFFYKAYYGNLTLDAASGLYKGHISGNDCREFEGYTLDEAGKYFIQAVNEIFEEELEASRNKSAKQSEPLKG